MNLRRPRRSVFDNIQIFRRKNNQIQDSKQFSGFPDRNAVDCDSLGTVFLQMNINPVFHTVFFHNGADMCLVRVKADHFLVLAAFVGLCGSADIQGFQHIRLSLGIISVQDIGSGIKSDAESLIVAKILLIPVIL